MKLSFGTLYSNPIEKRVETLVKKRADGKVSVYTDKVGEVVDVNPL